MKSIAIFSVIALTLGLSACNTGTSTINPNTSNLTPGVGSSI